MAVAFVRHHTPGSTGTSGATVSATTAASVAAGNLLVAFVAFDNIGEGPDVSGVSVPSGESGSWVKLARHGTGSSSTADDVCGELWGIVTSTAWSSSETITATLSASVAGKTIQVSEFSGASVNVAAFYEASLPSRATAPYVDVSASAGDLVIGAGAIETSSTAFPASGATDTTGGAWSADSTIFYDSGSATTSVQGLLQYKIPTTTETQRWGWNTGALRDGGLLAVALEPATVAAPETGALAATLPGVEASLVGSYLSPPVPGVLAASLPVPTAALGGAYTPPPIVGSLAATLPTATLEGTGFYVDPGAMAAGALGAILPAPTVTVAGSYTAPLGPGGHLAATLPVPTLSLGGRFYPRNGYGLVLDSETTVDAEAPLPATPSDSGTPALTLHVVTPTVPTPVLVNGRPS